MRAAIGKVWALSKFDESPVLLAKHTADSAQEDMHGGFIRLR